MKFKALVAAVLAVLALSLVGLVANAQQKPTNPPPPKAKPADKGKTDSKIKETPEKPAAEAKAKAVEEKKPEVKAAPKAEPKKVVRRVRRYRPRYTEHEPNNSNTTANATSKLTITGRIAANDTEDWFKLSGQEADMASFLLTSTGNANIGLDIYSGNMLVASFQGACLGKAVPVKVPDYCWIRVWRIDGAGSYKIKITPNPTYSKTICR